jgi:aryl-alcohol dehydrogenase-like predicted oxidoreductase/NAD-dependent dihydropyrimidine dehydrogenase PreA subunit
MKMNILGATGLKVSELCIGTLPMGPLQANIPVDVGADILLHAMENGVNFFDTAQMYKAYPYLHKACKQYGKDVIITSKSAAADYQGMEAAIEEAMRELNRDYIDIFLLHAARADETIFDKRAGAIVALLKAKEKGYIRFTGIATHNAGLVAKAAQSPELDVIYPLVNKNGMGIIGGSLKEMLHSIDLVRQSGKGMYAMKALAGGSLIGEMLEAIKYVREIPGMQATSIGVVKKNELDLQLRIFNDEKIDPACLAGLKTSKQLIIVPFICNGCGTCIKTCPNDAISMIEKKAVSDPGKCVLCGYCTPVCPEFAIRLI